MRLGSNGMDQVRSLRKITTWLPGINFCINWTSSVCFATSFMHFGTIPNAPKYYKTDRKISLGYNGVDWLHSLQTISTGHCDTNFCINCSSSSSFAQSFMQLRNDPKCTQTLRNTPKHEFRVKWGGLGAFVAKNTMWLRGTNFCINWTSSVCFEISFMRLRNDPKCTQILRNAPKH